MASLVNNDRLLSSNNKTGFGFNCWGATLYVLEVVNSLEWVSAPQMNQFLQIHTKVVATERRRIGDIIILYENGWFSRCELEHTAVYIGRGKYFHKKGQNISEITDYDGILKSYNADKIEYRRMIKK